MRWIAFAISAVFLSQPASAQVTRLTLACTYENAIDRLNNRESVMSGGFSAIVILHRAPVGGEKSASIKATTAGCIDYLGSFSGLEMDGRCKRVIGTDKISASLYIERLNGAFEHNVYMENSFVSYHGHCASAQNH
jgi:hypothetical protein